MKLSIIVPIYNGEKYVRNCITSLISQNLSNDEYEIIFINDGSIDKSTDIIEEYMTNHKNIRLISVKNGGQSKARNIGIQNAKGKYLFFVDADDYISEYSISNVLYKALDNNLDMIFFDLKLVNNDDVKKCNYDEDKDLYIQDGINYFADNNVNNGPWHFFISKKFIDDNDLTFVEGRLCEDGMFLVSTIFNAKKVAYTHTDVYRYVVRENSTTSKKSKEHLYKMIEDFLFAIDYINKYYKYAIDNKYSEQFLRRLESRRNSYIYFMQIRMIKAKVGAKYANEVLKNLRTMGCYKYTRMNKSEYSDFKTTLIWSILNCKNLFCMLCSSK